MNEASKVRSVWAVMMRNVTFLIRVEERKNHRRVKDKNQALAPPRFQRCQTMCKDWLCRMSDECGRART